MTHVSQLQDFEEFKGEGMLRLDLACGQNKREGFLGVDVVQLPGVDLVYDLDSYPYPWEDSSVSELHCSHFIEHVSDIKSFMEECYRILSPGGLMTVVAPYYSSVRAFQDFTHVRPVSEVTFQYFNQDWLKAAGLSHYGVKCNFAIDSIRYLYDNHWVTRGTEALEWARKHYMNVVLDITVVLKVIK